MSMVPDSLREKCQPQFSHEGADATVNVLWHLLPDATLEDLRDHPEVFAQVATEILAARQQESES